MRVAVFLPSLSGGGAERSILTIAEHLHEKGHGVVLLTALSDRDLVLSGGVSHRSFDVKHSRSAIPAFARYLRSSRPDVVLTAMDHGNTAAVAAAKLSQVGVPVVVSYRTAVSAAAAIGRGRQKLRPYVARVTMRGADEVVAISRGVAADLLAKAPWVAPKLTIIYNPTVSAQLYASAHEPLHDAWLDAWPGPIVLSAGRLVPQKGHGQLLAAFAAAKRSEPDAGLVILGQGALRSELEAQARELGIVESLHMPGYASNPYPFMRRCDAFVLASRREGLGNVLVEAGALGMPVVATDCPTGPREVLSGRPNTELVPLDDLPALARAMVEALRRERTPHPAKAWSDHSLAASVDAYEAVLQRAIDCRRALTGSGR